MNIYDIAKQAGVSIATVSRVVNGSNKVSEKTREKVMEAIGEAGYTPNVFARGLGLNSMKTIGIMCPDISDAFLAQAIAHLEKSLHQNGYECILGCSGYKPKEKAERTAKLLEKRIDTLIMVGSTYAGTGKDQKETEYLRKAAEQVPVFLINGNVDGEQIYCSYCDDYAATYEVTSKFLNQGRKHILFLSDSKSYSAKKKLAGYQAALKDAGLKVDKSLEVYTKNQIETVRQLLIERKEVDFDAVLATDDALAIGAMKAVLDQGRKVPEQVAVTGYNNSNLAIACEPELSSVDNHLERLCQDTVEHMIGVLDGDRQIPAKNKVSCHLVQRKTTDFVE